MSEKSDFEPTKNQLDKIAKNLEILTSLRHTFLRAIIVGVGTALGASIVAGIVMIWATRVIQTIDYIPFIQGIISSERIQNSIQEAVMNAPRSN